MKFMIFCFITCLLLNSFASYQINKYYLVDKEARAEQIVSNLIEMYKLNQQKLPVYDQLSEEQSSKEVEAERIVSRLKDLYRQATVKINHKQCNTLEKEKSNNTLVSRLLSFFRKI